MKALSFSRDCGYISRMKRTNSEELSAEARASLLRPALDPIFPQQVVDSILSKESIRPEAYRDVVVLFADIVGYTELCSSLSPMEAHILLHDFFSTLDSCILRFETLYKVESIGDCVMVVGGAPQHLVDCTTDMVKLAKLLRTAVSQMVINPLTKQPVALRIGINTGDVVGGVVGSLMPRFTFTGDAVNVASRMQGLSAPGEITLSLSTALRLARSQTTSPPSSSSSSSSFTTEDLEAVQLGLLPQIELEAELAFADGMTLASKGLSFVKGKGNMQTFTLLGHGSSDDDEAIGVLQELLSKSPERAPTVFQVDGFPSSDQANNNSTPTQAAVDGVFGALNIIVLTESVPRGKLLRNLVHKFHGSCTLRMATSLEEVVLELRAGGFRCDLLIFDTGDNEKVLGELKRQFPKFLSRIVSVLLSDSNSADGATEEHEALRVGADDCWPMPPPAPEILRARVLHHLLIKGHFQRLLQKAAARRPAGSSSPTSTYADSSPSPLSSASMSLNASPKPTHRSSVELGEDEEQASVIDSLSEPLSFLVVEDSPTQRKLITHNLHKISPLWTVETCADSASALALLRSPGEAFDVILVDLNLGEGSLSGDALVRELRGPGCDFQAPVIIGLNRSRRDTEVRFILSGADSAWAKPLPPQEVFCRRLEVLVAARRVLAEVLE